VLRNTITVYKQEIEKRAITYRENLDPAMPKIELDAGQMQRVFDNIVKNALDAMHDEETGSRLTITSGQDSAMIYITIADTGSGIHDGDADKIFDPFYTSKASGSGLGLTLAAQVITAHGGTITWQPCEPRGTCFIIAVPLHSD
jgi:signal transduction histidine kinase